MEESRVSDPLPFCVETEAHGAPWSSAKDAAVSAVQIQKTSGTSAHRHCSDAGESECDAPVRSAEEKFCRLQIEAAYSAAFCKERCTTPQISECNNGGSAGDSSAPSYSDAEAEDTCTDSELPVAPTGEKCCGPDAGEVCSVAFSSETSEGQSWATVGDSTGPSFSDTEADADHQLPLEVTSCRLEAEEVLSLAVFSETCESLSRSAESRRRATAAGDGTVSDAEEPRHLEDVPLYRTVGEGPGPHRGWGTGLSTMSSEMEEGMWKEVRHGKRRPLQASKPGSKRVPRIALVALFDAVDAFVDETGTAPTGATGGPRAVGRGAENFATSGQTAEQQPHLRDEAPTEVEVWASEHLQAVLEAVTQRLENVERCVQANRARSPEAVQEAMEEQRLLLLALERKVASVMSLRQGERAGRRPLQQARVEALMRRLLRLRDALQPCGGGYTELDVQLALKGARRHLRSAQGAAAKLALLLAR